MAIPWQYLYRIRSLQYNMNTGPQLGGPGVWNPAPFNKWTKVPYCSALSITTGVFLIWKRCDSENTPGPHPDPLFPPLPWEELAISIIGLQGNDISKHPRVFSPPMDLKNNIRLPYFLSQSFWCAFFHGLDPCPRKFLDARLEHKTTSRKSVPDPPPLQLHAVHKTAPMKQMCTHCKRATSVRTSSVHDRITHPWPRPVKSLWGLGANEICCPLLTSS